MKVFVLEDEASRILSMRRDLLGNEVMWCRNFGDACHKWEPPYDLALLDFDLTTTHYHTKPEECLQSGADFIDWLFFAGYTASDVGLIIVHTLNIDGSKIMMQKLRKADFHCLSWPYDDALADNLHFLPVSSTIASKQPRNRFQIEEGRR